jgi:type II secretory pathway component PulF
MLLSIAKDERAAQILDDVASMLAAGLPLAAMGGSPEHADDTLGELLRQRGVQLSPTETTVLRHAWRAGRADAALRQRADDRRRRAESARAAWVGIRYPLFLLAAALSTSLVAGLVIGYGLFLTLAACASVGALLIWLALRGHRRGTIHLDRWPVIGPIRRGIDEVHYLETLLGLYASGVRLAEANHDAVEATPPGDVRAQLRIAASHVAAGGPLGEALAHSASLHPETRSILASGEVSGQLEDALRRAHRRRQDVVAHDIGNLARRAGHVAYAIAIVLVMAVAFQFYGNYFAALRGR